jgi:DeoR family transcriptional regulator, glycerol-3-phosphate regulon repressor
MTRESQRSSSSSRLASVQKPMGIRAKSKHAAVHQRHQEILKMIGESGFASIQILADHFKVTPQTIRRDLNILGDNGMVLRFHGGAGLAVSTENVDYADRKVLCLPEKKRIALMTASHIPTRASLFINIGTTNEEVAKYLFNHERLRVITNNLNVAKILADHSNIEVIIAGGLVRQRDCGIVGEAASDFIRQFKVDYGIIGISGIDLDGTLLDFDYREVRAARAIIENSRKVFLVADHTKIGRNAMVRLGNIDEIDALFTDRQPPAELVEVLHRAEVELHVADLEDG